MQMPSYAQTYGTPAGVIPAETTVFVMRDLHQAYRERDPGDRTTHHLIGSDLNV
jgi:hypothetical protein